METFIVSNEYLIIRRDNKKGRNDCIVYFYNEPKSFGKIVSEITDWNCYRCLVFSNSVFHLKGSYILSIMNNPSFMEKIEIIDSLPRDEITRDPQLCPVTFQESTTWNDISNIVIIPGNGWDFYELEWILQRWETGFGFFDYDTFWNIPTYPKDLYNNPIDYRIVLFYVKLYEYRYSIQQLKDNFFGLYQFYKDSMGNLMLKFFYEETVTPSQTNIDLYKRIHMLYHTVPKTHKYRLFLFHHSYSTTSKLKFKLYLFILQFLSFEGMFVCGDFCQRQKKQIINGLEKKNIEYYSFLNNVNDLEREINSIHIKYKKNIIWIGKEHVSKMKSSFWNFVHQNWNYLSRNICLWDIRTVNYSDNQIQVGEEKLTIMFPIDWVRKFDDKNFVPIDNKKLIRKI